MVKREEERKKENDKLNSIKVCSGVKNTVEIVPYCYEYQRFFVIVLKMFQEGSCFMRFDKLCIIKRLEKC